MHLFSGHHRDLRKSLAKVNLQSISALHSSTATISMPPRLPVRLPRVSRHCATPTSSSLSVRFFTSTSPSLALGPESPNYIDVPKPLQPAFPPKPRIKGVLPTPRNVFKTRNSHPKESDEFIKQSTPNPIKQKIPGKYSRDADYRLHKQRLAESRKQALREGVKELHVRKSTIEARAKASMQATFEDKRARAMAPPKDVDVLTQTSVSKSIRDFLDDELPSTSRSNIPNARRKAYERKMAKHAAVRQARLHDLYTNAREFIVNEEQLDEAIEQAFGTEKDPVTWDTQGREIRDPNSGKSPWNGPMPEGVGDMLQKLKGGEGVGLAKERLKKVAEELTGGKM